MANLEEKFENLKKEKLKSFEPISQVNFLGKQIDMPFKYSDASAVMAFFPISYKKANDMIGNDRLKPVSILRGKSVVGITIFEYRECPIGPFCEFTISIPVIHDSKIRVPIFPLLFDSMFKNFGFHVIMLGANSDIARSHIEEIFGYPTYHKNIDISIAEQDKYLFASLSCNDKNIISFKGKTPKKYKPMKKKFNTYYLRNNDIFRVKLDTMVFLGRSKGKKSSIFDFGNHEISEILKSLDIENNCLEIVHYKKAVEIAGGAEKI
ncbi:MAG: hypothetical protein U9O55_03240 [Patescibacteria group bacterium]|nr:hypothetical protein [Patescibacteria group bacterium]